MKVALTKAAIDDLFRIGKFIERDNPARASTFVDELYDRCQRLGATPMAFPLVPKREVAGIRRRRYGNYLIFYRIVAETVEILHVLNDAQDYERILFPDD